MSYRQGIIDILTVISEELKNYNNIETFRIHFINRILEKLITGKVEDIKRDLGIYNLKRL